MDRSRSSSERVYCVVALRGLALTHCCAWWRMVMDRTDLGSKIRAAAYLRGQSTLRSGSTSDCYWDKYRFESDPTILAGIADQMQVLLPPSYDKLAGMELGGSPLATDAISENRQPMPLHQKEGEGLRHAELGRRRLFYGGPDRRG